MWLLEKRAIHFSVLRIKTDKTLTFVAMIILIFRLMNLQLVHGAGNRMLAKKYVNRQEFTRAPRGLIFDRNFQKDGSAALLVRNINYIDFVIFGHYHSARLGDTYARSSSISGANVFSDDKLQLVSRASQNIHIFYNANDRDSIKIDLQSTANVEGYPIERSLEAYNIKSAEKGRSKTTIFEVVI